MTNPLIAWSNRSLLYAHEQTIQNGTGTLCILLKHLSKKIMKLDYSKWHPHTSKQVLHQQDFGSCVSPEQSWSAGGYPKHFPCQSPCGPREPARWRSTDGLFRLSGGIDRKFTHRWSNPPGSNLTIHLPSWWIFHRYVLGGMWFMFYDIYIYTYIWSFLATWNLSPHCQLRLNNACRTSSLWKSYQVDGSNPFGKVTVGFAESHRQKTGPCTRFPQQKPKCSPRTRILNDIYIYININIYIISYIILYCIRFFELQAEWMCPSWMFLSVSFHVDHVKFWILEVFLALGMFGREFGSILPGVISSITNPNNNCTLLFALETTENSYICIVVPWVIESTWINLTRYVQTFGISEVHWKQPFLKWSNWMSRCFTIRSSGLSVVLMIFFIPSFRKFLR